MKGSKYSVTFVLKHTVPMIFRVDPKGFCIMYAFFFLSGALMAVSTPCMQLLFDYISESVGIGKNLSKLVAVLLLLFGVKLAENVFSYIANFMGEGFDMKSYGVLYRQLQDKACLMNAQDYEKPTLLLALNRAKDGVRSIIRFVNVFMDILLNYMAYFLFIVIYFVCLHPALLLVTVIILATVLIEQKIKAGIYMEEEQEASRIRQQMDYYDTCILSREMAKETRVLGIGVFFLKKLKACLNEVQTKRTESNKKIARVSFALDLAVLLEYTAIVLLMLSFVMKGALTAGGFVAIFRSIDEIFDMLENLVGGRLRNFTQHYGKINGFFDFMYGETSEKSKIQYVALSERNEEVMCLCNVSYQYPGSGLMALQNVDLTIRKGETIAVVGENGAGKTTLARVLLGLLLPTEGTVFYDESLKELKDKASAVFQSYNRYPFSVKDSICMREACEDEEAVEQAVRVAGLGKRISEMEDGLQTQLLVEFGGIDLSGGEWQKLAIARAVYKEHEFLVLDEPTSAADPLAEIEMYRKIGSMTTGKTALIITHRLGCVKLADRVLVLKNGKIQGFDTHDNLLQSCEYYKQMWTEGVMKQQ